MSTWDKPMDTFVIRRPNKPKVTIHQWSKFLANIIIEYKNNTFVTDWPLRYESGQVAYGNPHIIPEYAKRMVERII